MPLSIRTLLFVRDLGSGDCAAAPVVDASLVSHGSEAGAVSEQRLFLAEYLAAASPEVVARFALPEGVTLHEVDVIVPREELPRRLSIETPLRFACIVVPSGDDAWAIVPALDHTFYVRGSEDLHDAVRAEVRRVVAARELTPWEYLRLFPARAHTLEAIDVPIDRGATSSAGRARSARKALLERERRRWAREVLASVATRVEGGEPAQLVARDADAEQIVLLLDGHERNAILVTGPHLAGKSALLLACFAKTTRPVYATSGTQLVAGMSAVGQWQERVRSVMDAAEVLDAILYFDNLGDLLGDRAGGALDVARAMTPWLEEGRVRVAAELRTDLLESAERHGFGFLSFFSRVRIEQLDEHQTTEALHARASDDRRRDRGGAQMHADAIAPLVTLAARYLPYQAFPGKAMRLYDELRTVHEKLASATSHEIRAAHVYELFAARTKIPLFLLRDDRALYIEDFARALAERVIGQDEAVRRVAETVCVVKAQLQPAGKPLASFLFTGPTGVGKTELARALAVLLFGSVDRLVRFDMSELTDEGAAERLLRGTDRVDGLLTRKVREQPFSVVLLDEIEKAHPAVLDLLLQVCGEARLTDARGRTAYFHNTILIMTSNLGGGARRPPTGFGAPSDRRERASDAAAHALAEVARAFRPELVNRLDRIVTFAPLPRDAIRRVADLALAKVRTRRGLVEARVRLDVSDAALDALTARGYSEAYGARALRRCIEDELVAPVARVLAALGPEARGVTVRVRARGSEAGVEESDGRRDESALASVETPLVHVEAHRLETAARARDARAVDVVSATRREIDARMRLERVVHLGEHLAFVVTQLDYGAKKPGDRRATTELGELQADHHRLRAIWTRLEEAQAEAHALEELALVAALDATPLDGLLAEAHALMHRFRTVLTIALVAEEAHRDHVTLLLEDMSSGGARALGVWLAPLLRDLGRRGWSATVHVDGGERSAADDWPTARRWGPPREAEWMLDRFADADARADESDMPRNVLLRVDGAYAGVLLALEGGLHVIRHVNDDPERAYLFIRRVAMRTAFVDREWTSPALVPDSPARRAVLLRQPPTRDRDLATGRVTIAGSDKVIALASDDDYFFHFEDMALAHLLHAEEARLDRDELFLGPLDTQV